MSEPKKIVFESIVTPDASGYQDKVAVFNSSGEVIYHGPASCCPNPTKPNTTLRWTGAYGWIACGEYVWECIEHPKYGKCLLINGGGECPARNPNVNHDGRYVVSEILVHSGFKDNWRGSAACCTIPPTMWLFFMTNFSVGEKGLMQIVDFSNMGNTVTK